MDRYIYKQVYYNIYILQSSTVQIFSGIFCFSRQSQIDMQIDRYIYVDKQMYRWIDIYINRYIIYIYFVELHGAGLLRHITFVKPFLNQFSHWGRLRHCRARRCRSSQASFASVGSPRQIYRQIDGQIDRYIDRQMVSQIDRQIDRQINRQIYI